jgi:hypothetical protein
MSDLLWNNNNPVADYDIDVPAWIEQDISAYDIAAIIQGGCASGAYMPAVTYHIANSVMGEHGDDVLDYIDSVMGELPEVPRSTSWSGMAVFYLSCAVELWASSVEDDLIEAIEEAEGDSGEE